MKRSKALLVSTVVFLLSACGGGGDGGQSPPAPAPAPTFVIGGTLTGLVGSGLVLRNAGGDLTVSTNGAFSFPSAVPSGTAYSVTVQAQPRSPAQTCTVANGSGTVASAAVTAIAVTCVTDLAVTASTPSSGAVDVDRTAPLSVTFSSVVDGTTAAASVTLSAGSAVVPAVVTVSGSTVTVTPQARLQPSASHVLLVGTALRGAAGERLTGPLSLSFTTRARTWQTPLRISSNVLRAQGAPQVALNGPGDGMAVWEVQDSGTVDYYARAYSPTLGWGNPVLINQESDPGVPSDARVVVDRFGNAIAVWQVGDAATSSIWVNRYQPSMSGWAGPQAFPMVSRRSRQPQVAVDGAGRAIAVWANADDATFTRSSIWASYFSTGWDQPVLLETDNLASVGLPHVAMAASGDAVVVWLQDDNAGTVSLQFARYTPGAGWSAAQRLDPPANAAFKDLLDVAINDAGTAVVVWQQAGGGRFSNWSSRAVLGGAWSPPVRIEGTDGVLAVQPRVVIDSTGRALAVWSQSDGTRSNVWANRSDSAGTWGTPLLLDTYEAGDARLPRVALDAAGNAMALWLEEGPGGAVRSRRLSAAGTWSPPEFVYRDNLSTASTPALAVDGSGNALSVWLQFDGGSTYDIWANRSD